MHPLLKNFLWRFVCNFFNIHSTFGTIHDYVLSLRTIQQNGEIKFFYRIWAVVVYVLCNQHLVNDFPNLTGLNGNQCSAQDIGSDLFYFLQIFTNGYTPLFLTSDFSLATPTSMNLCFYNREATAIIYFKTFVRFLGCSRVIHRKAFLYMYFVLF